MTALKPIQTVYQGYRFRSRLEARWAVFLDAVDLQWEYEAEGYELDGLRYLPDFKVTRSDSSSLWFEIKPKNIDEDEKFDRFSAAVRSPDSALLLSGTPFEYVEYWGAPFFQSYLRLPATAGGLMSGIRQAGEAKAIAKIRSAALKAHQARFEHGASGW